jgi:hypothetical protein
MLKRMNVAGTLPQALGMLDSFFDNSLLPVGGRRSRRKTVTTIKDQTAQDTPARELTAIEPGEFANEALRKTIARWPGARVTEPEGAGRAHTRCGAGPVSKPTPFRGGNVTRLLCPAGPDNLGLVSGVDRKAKGSFEDARAVSKR